MFWFYCKNLCLRLTLLFLLFTKLYGTPNLTQASGLLDDKIRHCLEYVKGIQNDIQGIKELLSKPAQPSLATIVSTTPIAHKRKEEKKMNKVVIQPVPGSTAISTSDATKEALIKVFKPMQRKLQIDRCRYPPGSNRRWGSCPSGLDGQGNVEREFVFPKVK